MFLEIAARDQENDQLTEELESLRTRIAQVDHLQQENESLKAELGRLREIHEARALSPSKRVVLGEISHNESTSRQRVSTKKTSPEAAGGHPDSVDVKAIIDKCKELDTKYKDACKLVDEHRLALRKRSKVIDEWARHADDLQREIEQLRSRLNSRPLSGDGASTLEADEVKAAAIAARDSMQSGTFERPSSSSTPERENVPSSPPSVSIIHGDLALPSPRRILSGPPPACLPINDTSRVDGSDVYTETLLTVDDVELPRNLDRSVETGLTTIKLEFSSDPPTIVSTRSARKRKYGVDKSEGTEPQKIKSEYSSSSGPEIVHELHNLSPADSIDFDEEVHVPTPRKRRALPKVSLAKTPISSGNIAKPRLSLQRPQTLEASSATDKLNTPLRGISDAKPHRSSALLDELPKSGKPSRVNTAKSFVAHNAFTSNLALGVKDLAEDGDAEEGNVDTSSLRRPVAKSRLDALLDSPSTKTRPLLALDPPRIPSPRPTALSHERENHASHNTSFTKVRDTTTAPRTTNRPVPRQSAHLLASPRAILSRDRAPKNASILRDEMPHGRSLNKEDGPLRERPIEALRPEDFKPNPLYNDGLTFVYDEVVRGKDARAALSGCIDPNCCGKTFRRFALAELESVGSSVTRRAEDVGLMERYLGDEAFKLGMMTRDEREEAWLKAKTWELANKFGKHRQRYSRMSSPPGFWSMDFPSTQERAEELRQAEEIRKALVIERHREAMRCDGSWLFRDEEAQRPGLLKAHKGSKDM